METKGQFKPNNIPSTIGKLTFQRLEVNTKFSSVLLQFFFLNLKIMAPFSNLGPTQGPILLGKNYDFWSLQMRSFPQAQECWDPVDLGYVEPDPAVLSAMTNAQKIAHATQRNKENKAKFWIKNSVDDLIFSKITGAGTSKQAWDILKYSYQGNDRVKTVKLQTLMTQFETLRMTESENVDQFMTRVMGIVNQIRLTGKCYPHFWLSR
jgi:hypothetical protein